MNCHDIRDESNSSGVVMHCGCTQRRVQSRGWRWSCHQIMQQEKRPHCKKPRSSESHTKIHQGPKKQACKYEIRRKCDKDRVSLTSALRCDTQDHLPQKEKPQVTEDAQASNTPVPLPDCAAWHHGFNFSGHFGFKRDLTREAKVETSPDMT